MSISVYRQVELLDESSEAHLLCWLNTNEITSFQLKTGTRLSLKGIPNRVWQVICIYSTVVRDGDFKKDWKVGGIE